MFSPKLTRPATIATALVLGAGTFGFVGTGISGASVPTASTTPASSAPGHLVAHARPTNARSGPEEGGSVGKVTSVSTSGFILSTSAGEKVTVKVNSFTSFTKGKNATSALAVTKGMTILVLGTTNSATVTAKQVTIERAPSAFTAKSKDVAFRKGVASTSKQIGTIPTTYKQGSGTIVSGTVADKATTAALAAYPGGTVDRVVKISSNEYEVHNIGVNWPHHIFVNLDFKVVGAN